ncbi:hypothetical protein HKX48_004960 [Thoreauomyces humboldtii]|nr:hypothetical protein HKX48_004960 [Thoreauomyces humboldtii]
MSGTTNTNQEVLQFLQDLDDIVPTSDLTTGVPSTGSDNADPAGTTSSSQDVLSFLNDLDAPVLPSPSPKPLPPSTPPPRPTATTTTTTTAPAEPKSASNPQHTPKDASANSRPPAFIPAAPAAAKEEAWGWSNIWTQAARVGATASTSLTKGIESAKAMAEETAKAVAENEKVKGIINKEQLGKLGTDITRLTHTIVDTLAPPLPSPSSTTAASRFASVVTVYVSSPADTDVGDLRDFILATVREMWIGRICDRVALQGVERGREVTGVQDALGQVEDTMHHLQQLAATASPLDPDSLTTHSNVFLIIQPLRPHHLLDPVQTQYYVSLDSPSHTAAASALSQSVAVPLRPSSLPSSSSPVNSSEEVVDTETERERETTAVRWARHQKRRVVETVVADVCEEFAVACCEVAERRGLVDLEQIKDIHMEAL